MYVDRSNAAHCNTHVFYKSTVCAYLMGMCVALQQCTCVVSSIRILSPTECIHSGLVHKHARSYMCVVSCTYIIATKGVCIDTFRPTRIVMSAYLERHAGMEQRLLQEN